MSDIQPIYQSLDDGDLNQAGLLLKDFLFDDPKNVEGWTLLARFCIDTDKAAWAYPIALMAVEANENWRTLMMLGAVESVLQIADDAIATLKKALSLMPESEADKHKAIAYRIMASTQVQAFHFDEAEYWAEKSLAIEEHHQARTAYAFAKLHKREWAKGWKAYTSQLGMNGMRKKHDYGLPEWQGETGDVLVYGDQGLGDQIAYLSAFPQTPKQINCHPKLQNLMARSFPNSEVYGDMFIDDLDWQITSQYQTSMATAMQWAEMKRRGPYLVPNMDKVIQWRALLKSYGDKPKVGIAWTGGAIGSDGWRTRNLTLAQLAPLLELPYTFVSLEYREGEKHPDILDFPWGTQTDNYDDTAALVHTLDAVITVPTTAYHLAGGLGVPACVLVHDQPHFHEGIAGDCPWWQSVDFIRRPEFDSDEEAILAAAGWLCLTLEKDKAA